MLSEEVGRMTAMLRDWVDPETGRLVLEAGAATTVLEILTNLQLSLRCLEAWPVPVAARVAADLTGGTVVDLAAVRRRRWSAVTEGPAA